MENRGTLERYLHTILLLGKRYCCVRSVDVALFLRCSKASVSIAVNRLASSGLLIMEHDGNLLLTEQGQKHMQGYLKRCHYFHQLLQDAGISSETAETEAFSLAVAIHPDTFETLANYLTILRSDPLLKTGASGRAG